MFIRNTFSHWAKGILSEAGITVGGSSPWDITVHDERVYRRIFLTGMRGLGNSYVDGQWDSPALDEFFYQTSRHPVQAKLGLFVERIISVRDAILNAQSVRRAFQVGERHYDLGNELYEKMLGPTMAYSSAYYGAGATNLDDAEYAKFEKICRLLELRPGMRVLEIGCGWGTFAKYTAEKYGVTVVGISVSKEQLAYANDHKGALSNEFHLVDYRRMPVEWMGTFDRVVSIEMIEAVGPKNMRTYMESAHKALKPGGSFLLQAIMGDGLPDAWISTYIFPNGVLPSMAQIASASERLFDITHVDSFGKDYDKTLMEWHRRFVAAWPEISTAVDEHGVRKYDPRFYRMWCYYLLLCAGIFRSGHITVSHLLLTRRG